MPASYQYGHPFRLPVPPEAIREALARCASTPFRQRVFDPATTLWAWMAQIASQDRSCREAVSRVAAYHAARGRRVSASTGAYTQARQRLGSTVVTTLARELARDLENDWQSQTPLGRPLFAVDGSMLSGPDTPSNQSEYPQHSGMRPGIGFPMMRVVFLVSLTTGAIMDFGIAPLKGPNSGESSVFRRMFRRLREGDVVVGDRGYESYWHRHMLRERGVDTVFRLGVPFDSGLHRRLATLGRGDWIINQRRPGVRPHWATSTDIFPWRSSVRLTSARLAPRDQLHLASTLLDPERVSRQCLQTIYRKRWDIEVDIRSIKIDLGMDILRCKTAEMLEKEAWMTVLTYNAVRALMARAAERKGVEPREVSFKGAMQAISTFGPQMDRASTDDRQSLLVRMLDHIGSHVVRNRPDRAEPRLVKRRRKGVALMTIPRDEARAKLRNGRYR